MQLVNTGAIVERIEYELRHAPAVKKHRRNIRQVVSEAHREIIESFSWPFLQKTAALQFMPDLTIPNGSLFRAAARTFYIPTSALVTAGAYTTADTNSSNEFLRHLHGATLDLADRTLRNDGNGNWSEGPFEIEIAYTDSSNTYIVVDPRADITTKNGSEGSFLIRFPRYQLPSNCAAPIEIRNRSTRYKLRAISAVEAASLSTANAAEPQLWYPDTGLGLRFAPAGAVVATSHVPVFLARNDTAYGFAVEAPATVVGTFTATAANVVSGSLPAGKYRVFVAWAVAGRLSPPSEIKDVTISGTNDGIELTDLPVLDATTYGRRLTIWLSYEEGPFYLDQSTTATAAIGTPTTESATDTARTVYSMVDHTQPWKAIRWDEAYAGPNPVYIGVWPRPATPTEYELLYVKRPRDLISNQDAPDLPVAFNDLLVWESIRRLVPASSDEKLYKMATALGGERLRALRTRYGANDAKRNVRAQIDGPALAGQLWPEIDHTSD